MDDVDVNFKLGTHGANVGFNEKGWNASVSSLVWEASLPSQTQPTLVGIVFRILKTTYAGVGWSGLWDYERLPHLQRHLGGQYWRTATMPMRPCWSVCCGGWQGATLGTSVLDERDWPLFFWSCFCILHFSVHFLSHHTQYSLSKGTLWIKGTASSKKEPDKTSPV